MNGNIVPLDGKVLTLKEGKVYNFSYNDGLWYELP